MKKKKAVKKKTKIIKRNLKRNGKVDRIGRLDPLPPLNDESAFQAPKISPVDEVREKEDDVEDADLEDPRY